jgi:hypothetical protein
MPESKIATCDMVVQIVFRNVEDYVKVKQDPVYQSTVVPDHDNFADGSKTQFVTGEFEVHVQDGHLV